MRGDSTEFFSPHGLLGQSSGLLQMLPQAQKMAAQALQCVMTGLVVNKCVLLMQMVLEAQKMAEQALELKVMAAIVGNRVARLNSPMMAAKLAELKQRAEQLLKREE